MKEKIYKGTSKTLYQSDEDYALVMSFEDTMRVSKDKIIEVSGKGAINNTISAYIMQKLDMIGIDNHMIEKINMKRQLVQFVDIYPIQIHISTIASGRYVTEFGMENGFVFESPIIDFRIKNKDLDYPIINETQIINFGWLSKYELKEIKNNAIRIHDFLAGLFAGIGIRMVDVKLEFGRVFNGEDFVTMLVDEISPDTCRLWDMNSNEKLCYEIANDDPGAVISAYREVLKRLKIN
ncbi:MAG: phosphoribosylaminoimidazolesuccinocarboxamide synthase [Rickettsiales bacterium]|nr:MAG: phosphoribosylaminoimidazolesuccinocarboxamide synthase [Rickettsiales bacterium]